MTDLTDEQIDAIAERIRERVRAMMDETQAGFLSTLTPEQRKALLSYDGPEYSGGDAPAKVESLPLSDAKEIFAKAFADAVAEPPGTYRERWLVFLDMVERFATVHERIDILQSQIDRQQKQIDAFEEVRKGWDELNEGCRKMREGE